MGRATSGKEIFQSGVRILGTSEVEGDITFTGTVTGGGEANTNSSLGGTSIVGTKSGVDLPLKGVSKDVDVQATLVNIPFRHVTGTTSGTDTYTMTSGFTGLVEADLDGMSFSVSFGNTNTSPVVTLNIDGIGAKAVKKHGSTALTTGGITTGRFYALIYDGTNFQIQHVVNEFIVETGTGAIQAGNTADVIEADVSGGVSTVTLPRSDQFASSSGYIIIKDVTGDASSYTLTVTSVGFPIYDNIDGSTSKTITTDYGSLMLYTGGTKWRVVN